MLVEFIEAFQMIVFIWLLSPSYKHKGSYSTPFHVILFLPLIQFFLGLRLLETELETCPRDNMLMKRNIQYIVAFDHLRALNLRAKAQRYLNLKGIY